MLLQVRGAAGVITIQLREGSGFESGVMMKSVNSTLFLSLFLSRLAGYAVRGVNASGEIGSGSGETKGGNDVLDRGSRGRKGTGRRDSSRKI